MADHEVEEDGQHQPAEITNDEGEDTVKVGHLSSVQLALQQLRPNAISTTKSTRASKEATKKTTKRARTNSTASQQQEEQKEEEQANLGATSVCETTIKEDFADWGVDERIADAIEEHFGIQRLFVLQQHAIKSMIQERERDACVSAPTGSGKTLIYAIPLAQALRKRIVTRCRGLVLLPSRELARQVHEVVHIVCASVGLKCALLAGETSLAMEAKGLVMRVDGTEGSKRYDSLVDVVIATPGRLLDHVDKTEGFTLEHLEQLVVDEADRMLTQSYNDWLDRVYRAAHPTTNQMAERVVISDVKVRIPEQRNFRPLVSSRISVADYTEQDGKHLRRILCSATLTSNPQKLAALALQRPLLIDSSTLYRSADGGIPEQERLPRSLKEIEYKVTAMSKPVVMLHILQELLVENDQARILIFASALARASKIHSLISSVLGKNSCALVSSDQTKKARAAALDALKNRKVRVLVASDLAARGIDIPALEFVLSYDIPSHATTYVHRAGRTARAGLSGTSIVLLRRDQARHFRQIKKKLGLPPLQFKHIEREQLQKSQEEFDKWKSLAEGGGGNNNTLEDDEKEE